MLMESQGFHVKPQRYLVGIILKSQVFVGWYFKRISQLQRFLQLDTPN